MSHSLQELPDHLVPDPIRGLQPPETPWLAAFDADGVLWLGDVAEDFAAWMVAEERWSRDLWEEYLRLNETERGTGWRRMLRFYEGESRVGLQQDVQRFWQEAAPRPWNPRVLAAVQSLRRRGGRVVVVSATPAVVLEPLPNLLGLQQVLALELEEEGAGRFTGAVRGTPSVADGKARRIQEYSPDPVLVAVGNSMHDEPMLRLARQVAWTVNPDPTLRALAEERGWYVSQEHGGAELEG